MQRALERLARRLLPVLIFLWTGACTLDIDSSLEAPAETWDASLNTHPDGASFQELLDRYVHEGIPGVVLLVRTPDGQWNGAAGYAKIENSSPMQASHLHFAGSITKMYVAAAVMLLAEDGLIDLDERIREYLPSSVYERVPNGDTATVRQVLGHTSGIWQCTLPRSLTGRAA